MPWWDRPGPAAWGYRPARRGLRVDVDPLDTPAGRQVRETIAAGVPVYARPVIDFDASEFKVDGDTATVSRAEFRYVLVKPTDAAEGLDPLKREREGRGLSLRRRILIAGAA